MRGEVISYDTTAGTGLISGDDGVRYGFDAGALQSPTTPAPGVRVDFVAEDGQATQILILAGSPSTVGVAGAAPLAAGSGFDFQSAMFSFEGRLRRSHFWIGFLIIFGANVVLGWIPILGWLISLALIWPNLAISVKRLHDMGRTGWLVVAPYLISFALLIAGMVIMFGGMAAGGMAPDYYEDNPAAALAVMGPAFGVFLLSFLVGLAFILWIGLTDSQPGDNRFGPNPKGL